MAKYFSRIILLLLILPSTMFSQVDWKTEFEKSDYKATSTYVETDRFFTRLAKTSNAVRYETIGTSPQGREIKVFIVSKEKAFTPEAAKKTGKPVLLVLNGIHSGEIEGKDASMLFLREMLVEGKHQEVFENVILLVIPIFSVDGHERSSAWNRINQNGPTNMGWRTTAQNINLNRDWMKADAPEMRAMLGLFSAWMPDFTIDNHTTDGADYQYTVTYGLERHGNIAPNLAKLSEKVFLPFLIENVESAGWLVAPYVYFKDNNVEKGMLDWASTPRFSGGYTAAQNRISLLVETHMMKPYKDRVFATKSVLETTAKFLVLNGKIIREENNKADNNMKQFIGKGAKWLPIKFSTKETAGSSILFKGIEAVHETSAVSGTEKIVYTGKKFEKEIPVFDNVIASDSMEVPSGYIIPAEYSSLVSIMELHGIKVEKLEAPKKFLVERLKFKDFTFAKTPYEGRFRVTSGYDVSKIKEVVPSGAFFVSCDQRALKVINLLLEPRSEDSFLSWGFFNQIFEMKEYFEDYVMEKVALEMLAANPALKKEFEEKIANDEKFRNDPDARLSFFYKKSPYFDKNYCVYPILRVVE